MLQIATFQLPDQQDQANEFLKTHKPMGEIARRGDLLFIAYETGDYPVEYQVADLQDLIRSANNIILQQQIAIHAIEYERADIQPGKQRYDEMTTAISQCKRQIDIQQVKIDYVQKRIAALKEGNGEGN
jgi:hypothetical protein